MRNDLFVAHASIYHFASRFVRGANVLDAGCGTGYGARILADEGAAHVHGVDIDPLTIAYARRHYGCASVSFERADCQALGFPPACFDFVFASNVLEHLVQPDLFLRPAFAALRPGGLALLAVPPIASADGAALHEAIHYHRSNLTVARWSGLLCSQPWTVRVFAHTFAGPGPHPDFASPFPSVLSPSRFAFTETAVDRFQDSPAITAVFLAARPAP